MKGQSQDVTRKKDPICHSSSPDIFVTLAGDSQTHNWTIPAPWLISWNLLVFRFQSRHTGFMVTFRCTKTYPQHSKAGQLPGVGDKWRKKYTTYPRYKLIHKTSQGGLEVQLSGLGMQRKTYNHSRVCGQALQRREVKAGHKGDTTARVGEQGKHKISSLALGVLG